MKKILALIVALVLVLSVCACSGNNEDGKDSSATTTNSDVTTANDETTAGGDETTAKTYTTEEILEIVGTALNSYSETTAADKLATSMIEFTTKSSSTTTTTYKEGEPDVEEIVSESVAKFDGKGNFSVKSGELEIVYVGGTVYAKYGDKAIKGALTDMEQVAQIISENVGDATNSFENLGLGEETLPTDDIAQLKEVFKELNAVADENGFTVTAKGIDVAKITEILATEAAKNGEEAEGLGDELGALMQMIDFETLSVSITATADAKLVSLNVHVDVDMTALFGMFDENIVSVKIPMDIEETVKYTVDEITAPEGEYEEVEMSAEAVSELQSTFDFDDFDEEIVVG